MTEPTVGMGATLHIGSDSYPYTVTAINFEGTSLIEVREDWAEKDKGYDYYNNQVYTFSSNTKAKPKYYRQTTSGWREVEHNSATNRWRLTGHSGRLSIGKRSRYSDPSF